jgi:HEPN domain-containing protein
MGRRALKDGNYAFAVLAAQECVEFSIKGALRRLGIEHPKTHDVSQVLVLNKDRLPENFAANLERVREVSRSLTLKRSQAAYGDELSGTLPDRIFSRGDAESALREASWVLKLCAATRTTGQG